MLPEGTQQDGDTTIADDRMSDAANDEFKHRSMSMRAHDNEIDTQALRIF
jgi:hypothetical protein